MRRFTEGASIICLAVLLSLGGSTGVAFAGHALNSPVATTNPGDFWISGNGDCDGTFVFDGVVTFNANAIFTLDVSVGDDLTVTDDVTCDSLYVGSNLTVVAAVSAADLTASNDLTVANDATISGELKGSRCLLPIGSSGENKTTDQFLRGGGNSVMGATTGYMMNRAGSIVGVTWMYSVDSYTPVATVEIEIRKNNSAVYEVSDTIAATGVGDVRGTQARGTDTFVAGDIITALVDIDGTIQYDMYGGYIEVQFDD